MSITLTVDTNTFISLSDADTYFSSRLNANVWEETDVEEKKKALITATKKINNYSFLGQQVDINQGLQWPRYIPTNTFPPIQVNYLPRDYATINTPQDIKDAVCEEALALLSIGGSMHIKNQKMGITMMSMGNEQVRYNNNVSSNDLLSSDADALVQKWIKKGYNFGR